MEFYTINFKLREVERIKEKQTKTKNDKKGKGWW